MLCPRCFRAALVPVCVAVLMSWCGAPAESGPIALDCPPREIPISGTSSANHAVSFQATLNITGNDLFVTLKNTGTAPAQYAAADVLTSFYFDILSGTNRPTLTYAGATGSLFQVKSGTADLPYLFNPTTGQFSSGAGTSSILAASGTGVGAWQFKTMDPSAAPFTGFGIGTVGNSLYGPNNGFTPQIVGQGTSMMNFGIYTGADINSVGVLNGRYLLRDSGTFHFTGVNGYDNCDIVDKFVFGMGTGPDSVFFVSLPEPSAYVSLVTGGLAMLCWMAGNSIKGLRRREWRRIVDRHAAASTAGRGRSAAPQALEG